MGNFDDTIVEEATVTVCCGAFATFYDETLVCRRCYEEVTTDAMVDIGLLSLA